MGPVYLPPWGLPRSSARILIAKVCLFVCLSVRLFSDFYRIVYAPASNADAIRVFSEVVQKRVRQKRPLSKDRRFPGHVFFELFDDFCDF